jgi:hypothetical protein
VYVAAGRAMLKDRPPPMGMSMGRVGHRPTMPLDPPICHPRRQEPSAWWSKHGTCLGDPANARRQMFPGGGTAARPSPRGPITEDIVFCRSITIRRARTGT